MRPKSRARNLTAKNIVLARKVNSDKSFLKRNDSKEKHKNFKEQELK